MIRQAISLSIRAVSEFEDDEEVAEFVCDSLDLEECPEWLYDLISDIREMTDEHDLVDAHKDSLIEDICERYEEAA